MAVEENWTPEEREIEKVRREAKERSDENNMLESKTT